MSKAKRAIEIRNDPETGELDEVCGTNCTVHLEQMDDNEWFLLVSDGETEVRVFLSTPRTKIRTVVWGPENA